MKFRKDINGLRAIAVMAVVLFHFKPDWVQGGFAGVDVFFAISGFLMTGIIFRGLEDNSFSLVKFYVARANRIIPTLAVLCIAMLVFGWFYLTPLDYQLLGKHVVSSISFLSNVTYWGESGYFDAANEEKWLLHTWSLSVEWQFYILYPIVLLIFKKILSLENIKRLIVAGTIIGFVFCAYATSRWPNPSYYLLPTRAWEMMLGGVAFLYPFTFKEKNKKWLEIIGLFLIVASYFFISKDNFWPGYLALAPVSGAYLLIIANHQTSVITNNIVLQKIGLWSYSIYLWHWPMVVLGFYFAIPNWTFIGIPISVVLGYVSFTLIESKKRKNLYFTWGSLLQMKLTWSFISIVILSGCVSFFNGFESRFPRDRVLLVKQLENKITMPQRDNGYCFYYFNDDNDLKVSSSGGTNCILGDQSSLSPKALLFGDSFAGHNDPFWNDIFAENKEAFQSVSTNACYPSFSENFPGPKSAAAYKQCLLNRKFLRKVIKEKTYDNLILAASWDGVDKRGYLKEIEDVLSYASQQDIRVFVMATPLAYKRSPVQPFLNGVYKSETVDLSGMISPYKDNNSVNDKISNMTSKYNNVHFLNRDMLFNNSGTFKFNGFNVPYSLDGAHMSLLGSKYSAKHFKNTDSYKKILALMDLS